MSRHVWLVGSGGMAVDYARVLDALETPYTVIGRGAESAARFEERCSARVVRGGLAAALGRLPAPDCAIIAVGVESLAEAAEGLMARGVRRVLVEKPAGLDLAEVLRVETLRAERGGEVYVAYNRRFYASVRAARRLIADDGGVTSFTFEFTEFGHEIEKLDKAPGVKENWVLANSSHVLDLAFHLGGEPHELWPMQSGRLSWHAAAAVFAGTGRTKAGALFSYHANWASAGRWGVELNTERRRLIFRPMEQLQEMLRGTVAIVPVDVEDADIDKRFKPGLYRQVEAFLSGAHAAELCSLTEHCRRAATYARIAGYTGPGGKKP